MVTITDVQNKFKTQNVIQIDKKQLFIVDTYYLVSYLTVVGIRYNTTWVLANRNYGRTTSKQLAQFWQQHPGSLVCYQIRSDNKRLFPINRDGSLFNALSTNKD